MTSPVIAPPAILTDSHGNRWVYAGMSDIGPAYQPQQTPLPMIAAQPAHVAGEWANVTAQSAPDDGLGDYQREWVDSQVRLHGGERAEYVAQVKRAQEYYGEGE